MRGIKGFEFQDMEWFPPWQLVAVSELKTLGDSSKDIGHLLCSLTSKFDSYQAAKTASLNMMLPSGSPVEKQLSSRIRERCLGGEVTKPPTSLPPLVLSHPLPSLSHPLSWLSLG